MWDIVNTLRIAKTRSAPLMGLATDDSHEYFNSNPHKSITGRGWVMVRAKKLTPAALIKAMRAGDFYASSGVTLKQLQCSEKHISLEIDPVGEETYVTTFVGTLKGYDDTSSAVTDKEGKPIRATRRYSQDVGRVLATVKGRKARYELTGKELYVRAIVSSSAKPDRPIFGDQVKKAWIQPVGWRHQVDRRRRRLVR